MTIVKVLDRDSIQ